MPTLRAMIESGQVCTCLRNKNVFYESTEPDALNPFPDAGPKGPFWCAITQSILGPDGAHADAEACRPGRGCCESS
ncbi:MAG: hypothetical protein ABSA32_05990 [Candidatus Acidiferrales bacterium]|jgi:hypothetical protein